MDFVAVQDFVTPYVVSTGMPHKPTKICKKKFKKGEIITGEIKTANGKPSFVLHKGVMVVPLTMVKQVITKDIVVSNFNDEAKKTNPKVEIKVQGTTEQKKKAYMDAIIIGALLGFGGTILAEKQGWITTMDKKNKLIGAAVGAVAGIYYIYRFKK
jgi:hypothetical protein